MKRLIFTRADVTIFEDFDYPEDPAPYAMLEAREFPMYLELEEAEHLGRALLGWVREHLERESRRVREHRRKLQVLRDAAADVLEPLPLAGPLDGPTLLELVRQAASGGEDAEAHSRSSCFPPGKRSTRRGGAAREK